MSTVLLHQIDKLERECHAAIRNGEDSATIALLARTLNANKFQVAGEERPLVKGLANMASVHADMLLPALSTTAPPSIVHNGLVRLWSTLTELGEAISGEPAGRSSMSAK